MDAVASTLANVARELATLPFHGYVDGTESNIGPLVSHFPKWNMRSADGMWCAAFVYHCCISAGFQIPCSPDECITCSLAGCGGWDEFASADPRIGYYRDSNDFSPLPGDIVLFDRIFCNREHDHIGIVLGATATELITAEGNIENRSAIMTRKRDDHIRAYIRIPDHYQYK